MGERLNAVTSPVFYRLKEELVANFSSKNLFAGCDLLYGWEIIKEVTFFIKIKAEIEI